MSFLSDRLKKTIIKILNDEEVKKEVDEFIKQRVREIAKTQLNKLAED